MASPKSLGPTQVDDLCVDVGVANAPYAASTAEERLPKVLAYPPSLTFQGMSLEDYHVMVYNLALACPSSPHLPLQPGDDR